jgi:hypothetical protein
MKPCAIRLLVAGVVLLACKRDTATAFERIELPGFSIELPAGKTRSGEGERSQYASGQIKRAHEKRPIYVVGVSWQPGASSTPEDLEAMATAVGAVLADKGGGAPQVVDRKQLTIQGRPAGGITVKAGKIQVQLVEVTCGGRALQLVVGAVDPASLVERMTGSLACHPDPDSEGRLGTDRSPVGFDGLSGWNRLDNPDSFAISDGEVIAMFSAVPDTSALSGGGADKVIDHMMRAILGDWTRSGEDRLTGHGRTRQVFYGQAMIEGELAHIAVSIWTCPDAPGVVGLVIHEPGKPRAEVADILLRARCLGPGEEPPAFELAAPEPADPPDSIEEEPAKE